MSTFFWGLIAAMSVAAVAVVALPLKSGTRILHLPLVLIFTLVPLTTIGLYVALGTPDSIDKENPGHRSRNSANTANSASDTTGVPTVGSLVDGLEARLQREPDDGPGWLLLARSYDHLDQRAEAVMAYERAKSLGQSHPELEKSLYDSDSATSSVAVAGAALRGRLTLSPEVAVQVRAGDTVFIFARESVEQRMPVAALRKSVSDLPLDFELSDAQAMVPGTSISDYDQLIVTARVSRTGNASDTLNGFETTTAPISPIGSDAISLLISAGTSPGGPANE